MKTTEVDVIAFIREQIAQHNLYALGVTIYRFNGPDAEPSVHWTAHKYSTNASECTLGCAIASIEQQKPHLQERAEQLRRQLLEVESQIAALPVVALPTDELGAAVSDGRCGASEQERAQWAKENLS